MVPSSCVGSRFDTIILRLNSSTDIYFQLTVITIEKGLKSIRSRRGLVTKFAVIEGDDAEPDVEALQGYPEDLGEDGRSPPWSPWFRSCVWRTERGGRRIGSSCQF